MFSHSYLSLKERRISSVQTFSLTHFEHFWHKYRGGLKEISNGCEKKIVLDVQFIHVLVELIPTKGLKRRQITDYQVVSSLVVELSPNPCLCISSSPGYTSGTAGWRRSTQWSSSTVSSPTHTSLSKCPQGRTSSGTVWWWSPSAPPSTSASLTWILVSHKIRYVVIHRIVRLLSDGCCR